MSAASCGRAGWSTRASISRVCSRPNGWGWRRCRSISPARPEESRRSRKHVRCNDERSRRDESAGDLRLEYAQAQLAQARLEEFVEFRIGDALASLAELPGPFD